MHRLKHRREFAGSIDIGARGKPDATGHRCGKIGDDITKEVVGDDDVESLGVSYQSDRDSVDVQVVSGDTRELLNNFVDDPTPQGSGIDEHVVLVDQGEMAALQIKLTAPLSSQG